MDITRDHPTDRSADPFSAAMEAQVSDRVTSAARRHGFQDAELVSSYTESAPRTVPGYHDIHTMASVLLAERVPADGRVLVLGAGGGSELKAFATAHPGWMFLGVDPATPMRELAIATLGPLASRVGWHDGYVADAPEGPFDGATALLLLHHIESEDRVRTIADVRRRLRPGAPFVVMHVSYPQRDDAERTLWQGRHIAYLVASGLDGAYVEKASTAIQQRMPALSPEEDRAILEAAGFTGVTQFFSAFSFRAWVGYA